MEAIHLTFTLRRESFYRPQEAGWAVDALRLPGSQLDRVLVDGEEQQRPAYTWDSKMQLLRPANNEAIPDEIVVVVGIQTPKEPWLSPTVVTALIAAGSSIIVGTISALGAWYSKPVESGSLISEGVMDQVQDCASTIADARRHLDDRNFDAQDDLAGIRRSLENITGELRDVTSVCKPPIDAILEDLE